MEATKHIEARNYVAERFRTHNYSRFVFFKTA